MEKAVIYGAGNWCRYLLKQSLLKEYEIVRIVDSDERKWNAHIEDFVIENPDTLTNKAYDKIIIGAKAFQGIAETLVGEFQVPQDKILYVDFDKNRIHQLKDSGICFRQEKDSVVEKRLFRKLACETIQESMLFECMQNGEFQDCEGRPYHDIIVVGEEEQFRAVKNFFSCTQGNTSVVQSKQQDRPIIDMAKYILTAESYKEDLRELTDRGVNVSQCVIVPLFDVDATVIV